MCFPGYDLDKLLCASYKRVIQLFALADKASTMRKLEIATGTAALHDAKLIQSLQQIEITATITDKTAMAELMTDENKLRAAEMVKRMIESNTGRR